MANRTVVLAALAVLFAVAGCGSPAQGPAPSHPPVAARPTKAPAAAPRTPSPASTPPPSPIVVKTPKDQQDAQGGVDTYLVQTLDALPKGTTLDGTRYVDGPGAVTCDDGGVRVQDQRDVDTPTDTDYTRLVATTGDLWRQWGWTVDDADDQGRADRVGHTPDGYTVQIEAAQDPKQRPSMVGSSPCFAAGLRENDIPRTPVIEQSPP
jgi:hypothetical protein